jgi:hypothetical protein
VANKPEPNPQPSPNRQPPPLRLPRNIKRLPLPLPPNERGRFPLE